MTMILLQDVIVPNYAVVVVGAVWAVLILVVGGLLSGLISGLKEQIRKLEDRCEKIEDEMGSNRESRDHQISELKEQINKVGVDLLKEISTLSVHVAELKNR